MDSETLIMHRTCCKTVAFKYQTRMCYNSLPFSLLHEKTSYPRGSLNFMNSSLWGNQFQKLYVLLCQN